MKFYIHWLTSFMDKNYQDHYWFAVEERKFQWALISNLCDKMEVNKRKIKQDQYRKEYNRNRGF
jgi:hypothetical protein